MGKWLWLGVVLMGCCTEAVRRPYIISHPEPQQEESLVLSTEAEEGCEQD